MLTLIKKHEYVLRWLSCHPKRDLKFEDPNLHSKHNTMLRTISGTKTTQDTFLLLKINTEKTVQKLKHNNCAKLKLN